MKIKTVSTVLTTNTAGQVVESRPVRDVAGPILNLIGQWVSPTVVEEAADGIPVRYVTDAVAVNSVGQPVAATPVTGGGYQRFLSAMTTQPNAARGARYKTFYEAVASILPKCDRFLLLSGHDEQAGRVDLASGAVIQAVNSPGFVAEQGFIGNGVSGVGDAYLASGIVAASAKRFSRDSAYLGLWSLTNVANNSGLDLGCAGSYLNPRVVAGTMAVRANFTASGVQTQAATDSLGYSSWLRVVSTEFEMRKNGALLATKAIASEAVSGNEITILKVDSSFSNRRLAAVVIGGGITSAEDAAIYAALNDIWFPGLAGDYP